MSASKQVLFLNELEEILEICRSEQFTVIQHEVYRLLEACLSSEHFQVITSSLYSIFFSTVIKYMITLGG